MHRRFAAVLLLGIVVATGCSAASSGIAMAAVARASVAPDEAAQAGVALDDFGFDLLRTAVAADANGVISPASIALALALARAGAHGETATQMDAVMHDLAGDDHPGWLNGLSQALAARSGTFRDAAGTDQSVVLRIANASFGQRDLALQQTFLDTLASRYGVGLRLVDYRADAEAARNEINGWVSGETEQRIPELIAKGILDEQTRLVLVNAIYLKAAWATPFLPDATRPGTFTTAAGTGVQVPMMHTELELPYASGDRWQAVELPYVGGKLAMTVIVPTDLAAFVSHLDAVTFTAIVAALQTTDVDLSMPKFGTETMADLKSILQNLGMTDAFDSGKADFSGITTAESLFISAVVHQANISVDEKGTEAAAATAVAIAASAAPANRVKLDVDRPFLFALRDVDTGAIVFLGQITDPSAQG